MYANMNNTAEKPLEHIVVDGGYTAIFRTIGCVGDSLSSGEFQARKEDGKFSYHDMFEYSWGQFIARMCGSVVHNFSRGGMTAKEYCETFADDMGYWNPKNACQAYIIALGENDVLGKKQEIGTVDDIDFLNWKNNRETFAGYYSQIIQRLKAIQPRAKFFLVSIPNDGSISENTEKKKQISQLLNDFANKFDNTYVIDLFKYAPVYDTEFRNKFYLNNHLNPMGYLYTAKLITSYIDYIVRHNMKDFTEVPFIGTDLHG